MRSFSAFAAVALVLGCVNASIITSVSPHHHHKLFVGHKHGNTKQKIPPQMGVLRLVGPLPADFEKRFVEATAGCMNVRKRDIKFVSARSLNNEETLVEVQFTAPIAVVNGIEKQAADTESKLSHGPLRRFLVHRPGAQVAMPNLVGFSNGAMLHDRPETPIADNGIDVDTSMPYGELEAFGREDTAQELTEDSIKQSDGMVDQLERAEVAEEKRAVFRALTRLRGAAITSFDGVARSQTGNIDEYNKVNKWRKTHPVQHLADEESDVARWAFPDNADLLQTRVLGKKRLSIGNSTVAFPNASSKV